MAITPANIISNPTPPGTAAEVFISDQLIAGPLQLVTEHVTFVSAAAVIPRGTVLGKITASGKYAVCVQTATDGSQAPVAIAADYVDPTTGDVGGGVYLVGEFNSNAIRFDASWTLAQIKAAVRPFTIVIKTMSAAMSSADPT